MKSILTTIAVLTIAPLSAVCTKPGTTTQCCQAQEADSIAIEKLTQHVRDSLLGIMEEAKAGKPEAMNEVGTWYYTGKHVKKDYKLAYEWWKKASLKQNIRSIANLGMCYQLGRGVEKDSTDAMRLYKKAIKEGHQTLFERRSENAEKNAFDAMLVGSCYEQGIGTKKDLAKAASFYALAAQRGSVDGMRLAGLSYLNAKNNAEAFKQFEKGAAKGDLTSQFWAGKMLFGNMGVTPNRQQGVVYMLKAAEAGMPAAQNEMGEIYAEGNGVTKNVKQAAQWYKKAARQGHAKGMWNYGNALREGTGVDVDYDQALQWLAEAGPVGYQRAFNRLATQLDSIKDPFATYVNAMKLYAVDGNLKEANKLFKKLEKTKMDEAKIMQAVILASKRNEKPDAKKGAQMLEKLPDNPEALFYLATLYETGNGVAQNMDKALELYKKAADKGYGKAQCYLGDIYYEGRGTEKDLTSAVALYTEAENNRQLSQKGATRLAECYESGLGGLTQDKKRAEELRQSKDLGSVTDLLKNMK